MGASDALLEYGRIPRLVDVDDDAGVLEIESNAAGVRGEEDAAFRIFVESLDELPPLAAVDAAVKENVPPFPLFDLSLQNLMHAQPLAEDQHLGSRLLEDLSEECHDLSGLCAVIRALIEQIRAVTRHAHPLQGDHQPALVTLGEVAVSAPFRRDARHDLLILLVIFALFG